MPGLDRYGPMGQGPMTGRKMGKCTNYGANLKDSNNTEQPENNTKSFFGRMVGYGRGIRRGQGIGRGQGGLGNGRRNQNRHGI